MSKFLYTMISKSHCLKKGRCNKMYIVCCFLCKKQRWDSFRSLAHFQKEAMEKIKLPALPIREGKEQQGEDREPK